MIDGIMSPLPAWYREKLSAAGRKGGAARGDCKRRGNPGHYARLSLLAADARRENAKAVRDKLALLETLLAKHTVEQRRSADVAHDWPAHE